MRITCQENDPGDTCTTLLAAINEPRDEAFVFLVGPTLLGIPAHPFLPVATAVDDGEVFKIITAAAGTRPDVLERGSLSALDIEGDRAIADEAFAHPVGSDPTEAGIGLGHAAQSFGRCHGNWGSQVGLSMGGRPWAIP